MNGEISCPSEIAETAKFFDSLHYVIAYGRADKLRDVPTEQGYFLDQPRGDRLQADIGHKKNRLDP
jgi:hypothetical protein